MLRSMPSPVAAALLRQLQVTSRVRVAEGQVIDPESGREVRRLTATAKSGEVWTATHEDHYKAACGLAELMGIRVGGMIESGSPA